MAQYTEEFLAAARHGYENTDQPMRELSRELGIGVTTLSTLAEKNGWAKRSQRKRGMPPAMQLLAEAQALASGLAANGAIRHAEARVQQASTGDGHDHDHAEDRRPLPSRLGDESFAPSGQNPSAGYQDDGGTPAAVAMPSLLDRLEQILAQLIAAQQLAPVNGIQSPQGARTLATLIQAMRALKGMRGPAATDTGPIGNDDDDDMPADIDEFRLDLARRIDAFVASRTNAGDAVANSARASLDADE